MLLRKVYRDLVTRRVRSALTLLGVIVGVAGLVAIVTATQGFARSQRQLFATGQRADLAIFLFNAPEGVLRGIQRVPGVRDADLRINTFGRGRLAPEAPVENLHFIAPRDFEQQVTERVELLSGRWPATGEALIEPAVADARGLEVGQTIFYLDFAGRAHPLRLSGIGRLPSALSAELTGLPLLFVPERIGKDLLDVPGYNELLVRLDGSRPRGEVADEILATLSLRGIPRGAPRFSDPDNFTGKRELDTLFTALYLFSGLALVLTGFIVGNTLAALVVESVREVGILKTLGATRRQVLGTFMLAALLYGVAGTVVGVAGGSLLGFALLRLLGRFASLSPPFTIEPLAVLLGTGVGLLVPLMGGLLPAWRASGITVKAALDTRGVAQDFGDSPLDRAARRLAVLPPLAALAVRNLFRRKARSLVTLLVVALAVSALLAAQATDGSVARALDGIFRTYTADAYLQFAEPVRGSDAGALRRVAGVSRAEAWLLRGCTAGFTDTRCWALPAASQLYHPDLRAGQWLDPRDPLGVVISTDLAAAQALGVGDRFPLRYRGRERVVTVRGVVLDNALFLGSEIQSKVFVPYPTFAPLTGQDDAADLFALELVPTDLAGQQQVLGEVDRKLAALRPSSTLALVEFETSKEPTRILTAALRAMVLLVTIVGAAGLANTLTLNVLERRREIGVLRAIGTDNRQLATIFLTEGLALGGAGWLVGLGAGWLIGRTFVALLSATLFQFPFSFSPLLPVISLVFALGVALAASLVPALAAGRIPTVEAIHYE